MMQTVEQQVKELGKALAAIRFELWQLEKRVEVMRGHAQVTEQRIDELYAFLTKGDDDEAALGIPAPF